MLVLVSVVVFVILRAIPADPVAMLLPPGAHGGGRRRAAGGASASTCRCRCNTGSGCGTRVTGDLGESIFFREPVSRLLAAPFRRRRSCPLVSLAWRWLLSVPGGLLCYAQTRPCRTQRWPTSRIVTSLSVPSFLWAIFFILLVGRGLPDPAVHRPDQRRHARCRTSPASC